MTSLLSKRIAISISLVVIAGTLTPSISKLAHALHGHAREKRCVAYGTNHIHPTGVHCDFHEVTLAPQVFWMAVNLSATPVISYPPPPSNSAETF